MRILYLIDEFYSEVGGTEQNLLWLLRHLPEPEFEKHFLVFSAIRNCAPGALPIVPRELAKEFGYGGKNWVRRVWETRRILLENKIDLIHCVNPLSELPAALSSFLAGSIPILCNRRDVGYHWSKKSLRTARFVQRFRTSYLGNSDAARQAAHEIEGIPLSRIDVIRNPVSEPRLRDGLARSLRRHEAFPDISDDAMIVGMTATVRPIKDHPSLLLAAKTVLASRPNTYFVMVGDSHESYRDELRRLSDELGISRNVIWFGPLDNPYKILPLFDVAVLSSHSESFSNAVLEYAAAGKAIVVSNVGGLGEIVKQDQTGFLVPPKSPKILAANILRFLDDPVLRERLGQNARQFAFEEFSEKRILEQYVGLYRSMDRTS